METRTFSDVQDTLFIPLAARAAVSQRFPEYFYDELAVKLSGLEQVKKIRAKTPEYSSLASVARSYNMDRFAEDFLKRYPGGSIANLGVGLETLQDRIKAPDTHFYTVDFPDVMALREKLLGKAENETLIGCDITDISWTELLDPARPVLFVVSGVFQYFKPEAVSALIRKLKDIFPKAEMVFDAISEAGLRYAQRYVKKSGNREATMYFCINDAAGFARENGVQLLEVRGFYGEARKKIGKKLNLHTRIAMKIADEKKRTLLLHLRLNRADGADAAAGVQK